MKRLLYDTHMHTPLCKHATGEPEEYAAEGYLRGLGGVTITCHNPIPDGWAPNVRMNMSQFDEYLAMVSRAREAWADRIEVLLGLESDFVPGMEGWLEDLHSRAPFNYILGSVHTMLPQYQERYFNGDVRQFQKTYFEHLAMAAETGLFDCLAHPDLVKNDFPEEWQPQEILDDICDALDRIAVTGMAMELNTSGLHKNISEMNPCELILREMRDRAIPVVIGSDAHHPGRVSADFDRALRSLEDCGYETCRFFIERKPVDLAIEAARQSFDGERESE